MVLIVTLAFNLSLQPITLGQENDDKIYLYFEVDELPVFGESNDQIFSYIYDKLTWSKIFDGSGEVIVSFIVDRQGKVNNVKIVKYLCSDCDEQVKEIIKNMPDWKPGKENGKNVNVKMYLPVKFVLK
ncbi:MAG: hypothetical protein DRQ13_09425 [Ignavibacteriae bacterium]|nr:MAG: hypothetical protein DRQ13_09425 [Ignavibacteriota bacterium]